MVLNTRNSRALVGFASLTRLTAPFAKGNMYDGDTNAERGPGYESDVNRDCVLVWVGCFGQVAH